MAKPNFVRVGDTYINLDQVTVVRKTGKTVHVHFSEPSMQSKGRELEGREAEDFLEFLERMVRSDGPDS